MRIFTRFVSAALLLHALSGNLTAQDLTARVEEYLAAQEAANHFMGSVLIARDGKPLFRKGFGLANAEHDVPNTGQTKFRLGSLTKQFTAAAVLLLQERDLLDVQDPIGKYVEDPPPSWADVRIHHLLTHTSGIPSFTSFPDYVETWMIPSRPEETMLRFRDKPLNFPPGKKLSYSNSGYILLAVIIENASGMRYEEFLQKNIFEPLAMRDSGHDTFAAVLKHRAAGYVRGESGLEHAPYHDMDLPIGGGDLYSTVDDLLKWDQALYTDRPLSNESRKAMFTSFKSGYGYGWGVARMFGRKIHSHGGGINGFASQIIRFPEEKATVIVLCNLETAPAMQVGRDLAAILFRKDYELPTRRTEIQLPPEALTRFVGRYRLSPEVVLTITLEDGRLMMQATNYPKYPLFAESTNRFFLKAADAQIEFVSGEDENVTHLVMHDEGKTGQAKRLK